MANQPLKRGGLLTSGRSSALMQVFSGLGALSKEERPAVGQAANRVKVALEAALADKTQAVKRAALERSLNEAKLDVTFAGPFGSSGTFASITQQLRRVLAILAEMGFQVYTSREVETDEVNFQLLTSRLITRRAICRIVICGFGGARR